jgi:VWFA-related protein
VIARFAALTCVSVALVAAQDQPPRPTFRTGANYVRVDVYPTKDGGPVLDLSKDDFEILEERAPQKIDQFEHIVIRAAGPQESRIEPNNPRDMRSMLETGRARVFVLFLDTYHVDVIGSHNIRKPLVDALDRVIGPEDLVGVMTPEMSPTDIAFARKTTTIDGFLTKYWYWGEHDKMVLPDPQDQEYGICYPDVTPADPCVDQNGIAAAMIDRRHEKLTLDALQDLVRFLRGVREERKAVLAVSDGWLLYRPDTSVARPLRCHNSPGQSPPGIDPRTGKPTATEPNGSHEARCGADRVHLALLEDDREFREILDQANAANTSFYPIDPRGLADFDMPIEQQGLFGAPARTPTFSPRGDGPMLKNRLTSLRKLADATDGFAILTSKDLAAGLKRVVDDLSSYYLLGYYSTGMLDGRFHSITVRVKRPGVQVRARRGFLAATPGAANAAKATAAASVAPAKIDAELAAVAAAVAPLAGYSRELPLRVQAAAGWKPGEPPASTVWIEGELGAGPEFADMWKGGAIATIELAPPDGPSLASARATIAAGSRAFRVALTPSPPLVPGDYIVRVQARSTNATVPTRDTMHVTVPPQPQASGAIWIRRGPMTAGRDVPTADLRFRRIEQAKVEILTLAADAGPARLLDQTGKALPVPVTTAVRNDADGSRWLTGQLSLAPLGPGSYVIELSEGSRRMLAAFRVVP